MDVISIKNLDDISESNKYGLVNPSKAIRMLNRIVLDITYECNLKCLNCNRFCGIIPRKNEINIELVRDFIDQSIELKKKWFHIYIAGGEPSLHSRLEEILKQIERYITFYKVEFGTKLILKYFTNNHSKRAKQLSEKLPDYIIVDSEKKDSGSHFKPICVAPIDLDYYDDDNLYPCQEVYQCGMTLNYKGYYPCAEAAAMDDIFLKKDLAIKNLNEVTLENMAGILHQTCRYCGHYFEQVGYRRSNKLMLSTTWQKFLENENIIEKHNPLS